MQISNKDPLNFLLSFGFKPKHKLEIKGFFLEDWEKDKKPELANKFIIKKKGATSLISEKQLIYACLGKKKSYDLATINLLLEKIVIIKTWDFDLNIKTFAYKLISEKDIFATFIKRIYFNRQSKLNYKTKEKKKKNEVNKINLLVDTTKNNSKVWQNLWKESLDIIQAVNLCRNLQDCPPNFLNAETFATKINEIFKDQPLVTCQILNKKEIQDEKMNLLLSVNAGSQYEPRVVVLKYLNNHPNKDKTALIGKGITFDTGGYSLKPSNYQLGMKYDMSGAAIVVSAIKAISNLKIRTNIVGIVAITDNCIGSKATLVESVITSKSGKTVEITNTDAEGRLILADAITYAKEKFQPKQIIELSTLTGAISVALGDSITGAFSNKIVLYKEFEKASKTAGEPIWQLPVVSENFQNMKSVIADLVNASKTYKGGSSNAAAFLFTFADKTPFLHLDVAGTATKPENQHGTGVMVQTLINFFQNIQKQNEKKFWKKVKKNLKNKLTKKTK